MPDPLAGTYIRSPFPLPPLPIQSTFASIFPPSTRPSDPWLSKTAYIDGPTSSTLTFGELRSLSLRLAYAFRKHPTLDLSHHATVAIFAANSIEYPVAVLATQAAGIPCTTANSSYGKEELEHQLVESKATVLLCDEARIDVAKAACHAAGVQLFLLPRRPRNSDGLRSIFSLLTSDELEPVSMTYGQANSTTSVMCFSSGTTGKAKGVKVTHWNFTCQMEMQIASMPEDYYDSERNVWMAFLPLFHMYGLATFIFISLRARLPVVILPGFEPKAFLSCIDKHRITHLHTVPPVALFLAKSPMVDGYDMSSVKAVICGAAPFGEELEVELERRLKVPILGGYGMTETTCFIAVSRTDDHRSGSVGQLASGMDALVLASTGELLVRGPNIMPGYMRAECNEGVFEQGGWMRTGDVVRVDGEGFLWVVDRVKELIKYKGFQVAPAELEDLLTKRPEVSDAGVIPIYSEDQATELPRAFLVVEKEEHRTEAKAAEISRCLAEQLAAHKRLRGGIVFVESLPRTASGKILRRVLRDRKGDTVFAAEAPPARSKL